MQIQSSISVYNKKKRAMSKDHASKFLVYKIESQKRKMVKKTESDESDQDNSSQNTQQLHQQRQSKEGHSQIKETSCLNRGIKKFQELQTKNQEIKTTPKSDQSEPIKNTSKQLEQKYQERQQPKVDNRSDKKQQIQNSDIEKKQQKESKFTNDLPHNHRPVQILAVSDNHGDYKTMNQILELKGDIFIHAGDFTYQGKDQDFEKFFNFLDKLKFRHKIVISGNHQNVLSKIKLKTITKMPRQKILSQLKKRCIYLQHEAIEIQGIKIFASPYTPQYCQKPTSRAFQYKPSHDSIIWSNIPTDIDLLITHGPPYGILDNGKNGKRAGSEALKQVVSKINPKYHVFGHIHESKGGMTKISNTTYINLCNTPTRFIIEP